jgi:hypothetical protein
VGGWIGGSAGVDGWMDEWVQGWVLECVRGWMNEWVNRLKSQRSPVAHRTHTVSLLAVCERDDEKKSTYK